MVIVPEKGGAAAIVVLKVETPNMGRGLRLLGFDRRRVPVLVFSALSPSSLRDRPCSPLLPLAPRTYVFRGVLGCGSSTGLLLLAPTKVGEVGSEGAVSDMGRWEIGLHGFPRLGSPPRVGVVGGAVLGEEEDWYESRDGLVGCR